MNNDFKQDANGNVDVAFYIQAAKQERDAYVVDFFSNLKAKLIAKLTMRLPKISIDVRRAAH